MHEYFRRTGYFTAILHSSQNPLPKLPKSLLLAEKDGHHSSR